MAREGLSGTWEEEPFKDLWEGGSDLGRASAKVPGQEKVWVGVLGREIRLEHP